MDKETDGRIDIGMEKWKAGKMDENGKSGCVRARRSAGGEKIIRVSVSAGGKASSVILPVTKGFTSCTKRRIIKDEHFHHPLYSRVSSSHTQKKCKQRNKPRTRRENKVFVSFKT